MKKIINYEYECGICHERYKIVKDALKCESGHPQIKDLKIINISFACGDKMPDKIIIHNNKTRHKHIYDIKYFLVNDD